MNVNSQINQNIKQEFVSKHVYVNVGVLVEDSFKLYNHDHTEGIDQLDFCEWYGIDMWGDQITEQDANERIEELQSKDELTDEEENELEHLLATDFDQLDEPYEYWAVSSFLALKLREQGHQVVDYGYLNIWGRPTTGQAILLDGVISNICRDMEILDGQENSWA